VLEAAIGSEPMNKGFADLGRGRIPEITDVEFHCHRWNISPR